MYSWWEEKGYFKPAGDPKKKSYVVPMPPPNVTGYLHMGHAMGTTLQVRLLYLIWTDAAEGRERGGGRAPVVMHGWFCISKALLKFYVNRMGLESVGTLWIPWRILGGR